MKKLKRIVTFIGHPKIAEGADPFQILLGGSGVIKLQPERRLFVVTTVVYDDSLTPLYSCCLLEPKRYESLEDLRRDHPHLDSPVLDHDHSLKIYSDEQVCAG
jgi:hypothetical protein